MALCMFVNWISKLMYMYIHRKSTIRNKQAVNESKLAKQLTLAILKHWPAGVTGVLTLVDSYLRSRDYPIVIWTPPQRHGNMVTPLNSFVVVVV